MATFDIEIYDNSTSWQRIREPLIERLYVKASAVEEEFFHTGLAVIDEKSRVLAVCVVYHNPALVWQGHSAACFGNFDCEDHLPSVQLLIKKAEEIAVGLEKTALVGPINGSTWGDYRLAIDEFDTNYLLDLSHPSYYSTLLREAGLITAGRYATAKNPGIDFDRDWLASAEKVLVEKNLTFRPISLERYEAELERIYQFCMKVFSHNPLFTPISKQGFLSKYLPLRSILDPNYVLLCEESSGALCGLLLAIPNYVDKEMKGMVVKTVAKSAAPQFNGMATLLCAKLHERMQVDGFQYVLHAFMEQSNRSNHLSGHFGGQIIKQYELFGKKVAII